MKTDITLAVVEESAVGIVISGEPTVALECNEGGGGTIIPYTGEYEVTPSSETQILRTDGKTMGRDVVINPVPNNYGLITWNGATLTVS